MVVVVDILHKYICSVGNIEHFAWECWQLQSVALFIKSFRTLLTHPSLNGFAWSFQTRNLDANPKARKLKRNYLESNEIFQKNMEECKRRLGFVTSISAEISGKLILVEKVSSNIPKFYHYLRINWKFKFEIRRFF